MQAAAFNQPHCYPLHNAARAEANDRVAPSVVEQPQSPAEQKEHAAILATMEVLLDKVCKQGSSECAMDLTPFLYSSIKLPDNRPSGAECAKQLLSGVVDRSYTLPRDEIVYIQRNTDILSSNFQPISHKLPVTFVSLGCGPSTSVEQKDIPLARAVGASRYVAIDINSDFASHGAALVASTLNGVTTEALNGDFTKGFSLAKYTQDSLVVLSMMGDTLGQFPVLEKAGDNRKVNGVTLRNLMLNLGKATDYKAILFATTDAETWPDTIESKYHGECMIAMMKTLWHTIKEVTGDKNFDPKAFYYSAKYNPDLSAVQFIHTADKATSITIRGKKYNIASGTRFVIGCSQKIGPDAALPTCEKAGWSQIKLEPDLRISNTVRMLALRGKNCAF